MIVALALLAASASTDTAANLRAFVDLARKQHGLPPIHQNAALQGAAEAHIAYMRDNRVFGHAEQPGCRGFTGRTPGDRAFAFGYRGGNGEVLSESSLGLDDALAELFAAPYHRAMFLQPISPDFGAASLEGSVCIKFGGPTGNGTVVSPPNNAKDVPTTWDGTETPDPLRSQNVDGPFGYPVIVVFFGSDADRLRLSRAAMRDANGREVAAYVLHPGNDRLSKGLVTLVPAKPLARSAVYSVRIEYANASGKHVLAWSFKTANWRRLAAAP